MASKSWRLRRRVLVVDDDPDNRLFVCDLLAHRGYEALQAASGWEALEILQQRGVDLVLLDLVMPTMDGLETLHEIRRHDRDLPVIMMGMLTTAELERRVRSEGAQAWLDKPVRQDALSVALLSLAAPSGFADS
jgi:CheY-like chemotaxis protein